MTSARTATFAWLQASPLAAVFALFFVIPLGLVLMVSVWQATEYELIPAFTGAELPRRLHRLPRHARRRPVRDVQDLPVHAEVQRADVGDHGAAGLLDRLLPGPSTSRAR